MPVVFCCDRFGQLVVASPELPPQELETGAGAGTAALPPAAPPKAAPPPPEDAENVGMGAEACDAPTGDHDGPEPCNIL